MKLSRLGSLLDQWIVSLQIYPLTHIIILIMTVTWMIAIEQDYNSSTMDTLLKIMATGALTLPLTLAKPGYKYASLWAVMMGLGYWLLLPQQIQDIHYSQQIWIIGSILIAWIIPSVVLAWDHHDSQDLTWSQFTHRWMSLVQGVIGSLIFWGGIVASLASIEFLFDVTIHSNIYRHIATISILCVGPWIWLINLQQSSVLLLETRENPFRDNKTVGKTDGLQVGYPRRMNIFGQYIFLPLCLIYGLILIAYGIKILATGTWPQGQLVYMVAGYIGFGLLTWFFLLPLERDNSWLSKLYHVLFISFVVTSGLMIGALIMRVQQYGWTIDRGIVVGLIAWIMIMSIGSIIWTNKKWIIGLSSLVVVGALAIYSLPSMIFRHQLSKTQQLLTSTTTLNTGDASMLYRSLDYLAQTYGTGRVGQVFNSEQVSQLSGSSTWDLARNIMSMLKINNYDTTNGYNEMINNYFSFYSNNQGILDIAGYKTIMQIDSYSIVSNTNDGLWIDNNKFTIATGGVSTTIDFDLYINTFSNTEGKEQSDPYTIAGDNYKLILTNANGQKGNGVNKLEGFGGYLLLK